VVDRQNADTADTLREGRCHGNHFLAFYIWDAHWRHLVYTTEPSMFGGDAALCQITLATCSYLRFYTKTFPHFKVHIDSKCL